MLLHYFFYHGRKLGQKLRQDGKLEADDDAKAVEWWSVFACFSCLAQPTFL